MKKIFLLAFFALSACSSTPYKWPEDQGTSCYQSPEQKAEGLGKTTCLRTPSYRDDTKWHRVREWQELPPIPDTP